MLVAIKIKSSDYWHLFAVLVAVFEFVNQLGSVSSCRAPGGRRAVCFVLQLGHCGLSVLRLGLKSCSS